jgi:MarR family transcriptional regulator, temperature-dependent positive regulator of motility
MIGHLLRSSRKVHSMVWRELLRDEITPPQFAVLHTLARKGSLTRAQIRDDVGMDSSTTADVLCRLLARRLVSQAKDPEDGRRRVVQLTAAGIGAYRGSVEEAVEADDALLVGLDGEQRARLAALLRSMLARQGELLDDDHAWSREPPR